MIPSATALPRCRRLVPPCYVTGGGGRRKVQADAVNVEDPEREELLRRSLFVFIGDYRGTQGARSYTGRTGQWPKCSLGFLND